MRRPRIPRVLQVALFNLGLALLLLELVALGAYAYVTGELYYLHPPRGRHAATDLEGRVESFQIHPYYGFTWRPGTPAAEGATLRANNFGFESALDYPVARRRPEELLVGLFGGSVAARLARFEADTHLLARRLAAATEVAPEAVRILNLAEGGFKQPQQLQILSHLRSIGQELDLAINLDGFNEVALGGLNLAAGVRLDMPSIEHMRALEDVTSRSDSPEALERLLAVRRHWARHARVFNRAWSGEGWELRFASGFLVDWVIYKLHLRRYLAARRAYGRAGAGREATAWLYLAPAGDGAGAPQSRAAMGRAVELWARSSRLMLRLEHAAGGCYVDFVQPNQYFDTGRRFSEAERSVAFSTRSAYPAFVRAGYPLLAAASRRLERQGLPIHPLLDLFDDEPRPVYADDCCHYTDLGQEILARRIGELAAAELTACRQRTTPRATRGGSSAAPAALPSPG